MKKILSVLLLGFVLVFNQQCSYNIREDKKYIIDYQDKFKQMVSSQCLMDLEFEYILKNSNSTSYTKIKKSGVIFFIGNGYALGLTHCFDRNTIMAQSPFGVFKTEIEGKNFLYTCGDSILEYVGEKKDLSLFKVISGEDLIKPTQFSWADLSKVKLGDEVFISGMPMLKTHILRKGIVSNIAYEEGIIYCDIQFIGGDSGSPVYIKQDGEYKIIGMAQSTISGGSIGMVLSSDYIQKFIEESI